MATCGELPPNSQQGRSFIQDPKIAGQHEVKAQIRLRFRNIAEVEYLLTRSFQLTQTNAKSLSFKTLDQNVIATSKNGEKKANVNARCAAIDSLVPQLMGFENKAVLQSVIFVHQDDSNWPLSDGATLKKHFDEIFASSRYTKAIDAITKLRKELLAKAREQKMELEHMQNYLATATRLRKEIGEGRRVLNDYR